MNEQSPEKKSGWRGSEDLWLNAAYDLLIEKGVDAVKVLPLAQTLGLSRTSFYGHFDSREALLAALVTRWRDKNTGNLIGQTRAYAETITEAVFNIFDCWLRPDLFDARLDHAIRNWALGDPALRAILEGNDADRIDAIAAMFERFGYTAEDARIRAFTIYYTQVGYVSMMVQEDTQVRVDRMPNYIEVFTGRSPTASEVERFRARHLPPAGQARRRRGGD
ncbi:TetR/AcrR family transcriptional regulator [Seohaeicola saemankumensis]|uniref:TetR/AcrR family transcriptional regulator n=1 Tax=Seohaeicola saemankumensis TaxID=481181 RepID=A0ABW3T7I1_9RHOB